MKQNAKWNLLRGLFCLALMAFLALGLAPGMTVTARAVVWTDWTVPPTTAGNITIE